MICSMLISPGTGSVEKRCVSESLPPLEKAGVKRWGTIRIIIGLSKIIWLGNFGKFSLFKETKKIVD